MDSNEKQSPHLKQERRFKILRRLQVQEVTGLGKSQIYALQKTGHFPHQIKLGHRAVGWLDHEIQAYIESRVKVSRDNAGGVR